jgi:hypothetical protein
MSQRKESAMMRSFSRSVVVAAAVAVLAIPVAAADTGPTPTLKRGLSDFGIYRDPVFGYGQSAIPLRPGLSDFGLETTTVVPSAPSIQAVEATADRFDWADAGAGAGAAVVLMLMLGGAALAGRRSRPSRIPGL